MKRGIKKYDQVKVISDLSNSLGKLPPQADDLEQSVLGAVILQKNAMVEVASVLRVEHFYSEKHQEIYRTAQNLFAAGDPIDLRTMVSELRKSGKLEMAGGAYYLSELIGKVSSAANIEYYARVLIEMGMKRSLINMASELHHNSYDDTFDVFEIIARTNLQLQEIQDGLINGTSEKNIKDTAFEVLQEVQARQTGKHTGIYSGYKELDRVTNGFQKTHLIIEAARPGMGKTAFAMQAGKQAAETGVPVGIFSLEMSGKELVERLACGEGEINSDLVRRGGMQPLDMERFVACLGKISGLPLYIDDTPFMTIIELRARAMRLKTKYNIKMLIVDYLQLIKGVDELGRNTNRDQEIGMITRTLKGIAKELDIPVIALSQLSRAVEQRGGLKKPQLSDLRESGSIEQDADLVMFLYRPEYYKILQDEDGNPTHGLCEVIIDKHRHGALETIKMKFVGKYTKFTEWHQEYSSPTSTQRQEYGTKHYKNPTEELPKDQDDLPF